MDLQNTRMPQEKSNQEFLDHNQTLVMQRMGFKIDSKHEEQD